MHAFGSRSRSRTNEKIIFQSRELTCASRYPVQTWEDVQEAILLEIRVLRAPTREIDRRRELVPSRDPLSCPEATSTRSKRLKFHITRQLISKLFVFFHLRRCPPRFRVVLASVGSDVSPRCRRRSSERSLRLDKAAVRGKTPSMGPSTCPAVVPRPFSAIFARVAFSLPNLLAPWRPVTF